MKKKRLQGSQLSAPEMQLIERLRQQPELMERFQNILEITASAEGPIKRAEEIEDLLLEQMRRLDHESMESWAHRAEKTLGEQLQTQDPSARVRKKKC
jgi:phosphoribosyl-dephospho-CoA transferase